MFIFMSPALVLGIIGTATGGLSLVVSSITIWHNFFRPANIKAGCSHLHLQRYSSLGDGKITEQFFVFGFSLRNIGTQPAIVQDIRLRFFINNQEFYAKPVRQVSHDAINNTAAYQKELSTHGAPFSELILCSNESWQNNFIFYCHSSSYQNLEGIGEINLQIKQKNKWKIVKVIPYRFLLKNVFTRIDPPGKGSRICLFP
jgi:hypothetical protein